MEKFKAIINDYYNKKLLHSVLTNDNTFSFPIMKVIKAVGAYQILTIIIIIFSCSYFLAIFWHIFIADIEDWKLNNTYDVY